MVLYLLFFYAAELCLTQNSAFSSNGDSAVHFSVQVISTAARHPLMEFSSVNAIYDDVCREQWVNLL